MAPCCSCNGKNAVCKRCACVRAGRPCTSCLPLKFHRCSNSLASRAGLAANSGEVGINENETSVISDGAHVMNLSTRPANDPRTDDLSGYVSCASNVNVPLYIDKLIHKAYGAPLIQSAGGDYCSAWCQRWSNIIHHRAYSICCPVVL